MKLEGAAMQDMKELGSIKVSGYLEVKEWRVQGRNVAGLSGCWVTGRPKD